jgi:hypothetical protein
MGRGPEMRVFDEPNLYHDWQCPICGTAEKKPVVLIGINGTEEGNNILAEQVHFECLELRIYERNGERVIAQIL